MHQQTSSTPDWVSRHISTDSAQLYTACQSDDPQVQAAAYETLWGYLYRVALQVMRGQPEAEALAQDCAQIALIRVHERLAECKEPAAFRAWARRIASHVAIDELRRQGRLTPLAEEEPTDAPAHPLPDDRPLPEATALAEINLAELRGLLGRAPMSERSRRAVLGRYLDDIPDELLAQAESELSGQPVLPSHVQVTRAKNIARLRSWEPLRAFLEG
jgi:RNA polymerase sigma factor (sigma-70 family)